MKKLCVVLLLMSPIVLQFCSSSKKVAKKEPVKLNYVDDVQALVVVNCYPCHFPPKGNKKPLDTYLGVKINIDDVIARIQRNPADKGFMPFKHAKLSDSTINVFVQWKKDGLLENK